MRVAYFKYVYTHMQNACVFLHIQFVCHTCGLINLRVICTIWMKKYVPTELEVVASAFAAEPFEMHML